MARLQLALLGPPTPSPGGSAKPRIVELVPSPVNPNLFLAQPGAPRPFPGQSASAKNSIFLYFSLFLSTLFCRIPKPRSDSLPPRVTHAVRATLRAHLPAYSHLRSVSALPSAEPLGTSKLQARDAILCHVDYQIRCDSELSSPTRCHLVPRRLSAFDCCALARPSAAMI